MPTGQKLWTAYGLDESAFAEARSYLRQEIRTFNRSTTAILYSNPDEPAPTYPRYAGTSGFSPQARQVLLFSSCSGYGRATGLGIYSRPFTINSTPNIPFGPLNARDRTAETADLASFVDFAESWAAWIISRTSLGGLGDLQDATLHADMWDPLAGVLSNGSRAGRLSHCVTVEGDDEIILQGFSPDDELIFARGEDLLECLTTGTVEGANCDTLFSCSFEDGDGCDEIPQDLRVFSSSSPYGHETGFEKNAFIGGLPNANGRWYLLRPRTGSVSTAKPGQWSAIAGIPLDAHATNMCRDYPIVLGAIERAGAILAPSTTQCSRSNVSCAGETFDARLPLEDELSDDNDGIEDSWQHYLNAAREAAAEADALGREYIQAGLEVDLREEGLSLREIAQQERAVAALEQLQAICGTSADPASLLTLLGVNSAGEVDFSGTDQGPCPTLPTLPPEGTRCYEGRVVPKWVKASELKALKECLSGLWTQHQAPSRQLRCLCPQ